MYFAFRSEDFSFGEGHETIQNSTASSYPCISRQHPERFPSVAPRRWVFSSCKPAERASRREHEPLNPRARLDKIIKPTGHSVERGRAWGARDPEPRN